MKKTLIIGLLLIFIISIAACQQPPKEVQPIIEQEQQQKTEAIEQPAPEPEGVYSVVTLNYPDAVDLGEVFNITWEVRSSKDIETIHTAIHYSNVSVRNIQKMTDYDLASKALSGKIPAKFSERFAIETYGTIYFRSHAIIDGKDYWSDEKSFTVRNPKPQQVTAPVKNFKVEADDEGFYPSTPINVKKGDKVYIEFDVRKDNVYYGGLQIKSPYFDTGKINPGWNSTVDFNAYESFTITSYWPASGVKKADLSVVVS